MKPSGHSFFVSWTTASQTFSKNAVRRDSFVSADRPATAGLFWSGKGVVLEFFPRPGVLNVADSVGPVGGGNGGTTVAVCSSTPRPGGR